MYIGGTVISGVVTSSGVFRVSGGGAASYTTVRNHGKLYVSGRADGTTVSNASATLYAGLMSNTAVSSAGRMWVSGGSAVSNTLYSGGVLYVSGGLTASTFISSGAAAYAHVGVMGENFVRGALHVCGGSALVNSVYSSGIMLVSSGLTDSTTVYGKGRVFVYGGLASNNLIGSDGNMHVSGGVARVNTIISGGTLTAWTGGRLEATAVSGLGSLLVSGGVAAYTTVYSGGYATVFSGGMASQTVVEELGGAEIMSGGSASYTVVMSNGMLHVNGGSTNNTVVYGGKLHASGCELNGVTQVAGNFLSAYGEVSVSGLLMPSLRGDYVSAYVRGHANVSGLIAIDGDDSDSGEYTLFSDMSGPVQSVNIMRSDGTIVPIAVDQETTVGELTYKFSYDPSGKLSTVIYGKYNSIGGRVEGSIHSILTVSNCRVRSRIVGARGDVEGNVIMTLGLVDRSPCIIYGGGNEVNVAGGVFMTITSGYLTGMIYGGSRTAGRQVRVGDVTISVSGIVHVDNPKVLENGNSAWLLGGGAAFSGSSTCGNVNITVENATVGRVTGGGQAESNGGFASVGDVNISLKNCSVSGDVYGGGYAREYGISEVRGSVNISLYADEDNFLYVYGAIFGGGVAPGHTETGGLAIVYGDVTITLSGDGSFYNILALNGDGRVGGTVEGVKTLEFKDFSNEFSASVRNFDVIRFSGSTEMQAVNQARARTLAFDLTGRTDEDGYFVEGVSFVLNQEKTLEIELGDASGDIALMAIEETDLLGAVVKLYQDNVLLGAFAYGSSYGDYRLSHSEGILTLQS